MLSRRRQRQAEWEERIAREQAEFQELACQVFGSPLSTIPGAIGKVESWWCQQYQWLKETGYLLRPRYAPGWVPSWQDTKKRWVECEDSQVPARDHVLDATRMADGVFVTLKLITKSRHPYEIEIGRLFSTEPLVSDLYNYSVPLYDVLDVPDDEDQALLVMPLLRPFHRPRFDTCGEVVDFFRQLFLGLRFIHQQHVAHRDCMGPNIMMDANPLYIDPYHPQDLDMKRDFSGKARYFTRTRRPPKYFFIDFGISRRYAADHNAPLEYPIWGGDKTVPEFQKSDDACNPFPTDIYYLGNMIRENFLLTKRGLEFMLPLVKDMVQDDPVKRPTMDEVVARFNEILKELSSWKLRSRVIYKEDSNIESLYYGVVHWTRRISYIVRRVSAIPGS
ncbi:hypothetical protein SERLA73DRAFT_72874 [Serpula lacrymans var. lacrymans S7.3]|uniref:Protein kinase domain-containing protein n=2 Tax=Serpula lacrymans var. lacrymans TaxID=341189 RepID=F8PVC6_SERL3|nr:uncharacterized protein SERLADRAFT_437421 [Serpula lacrymans var. lacrymans S7.9]EGO00136.1 hypothetical protein SERLA73DRAFT_72874 [Serpula lacrymans var. lacrymans S7.3]EGO25699.1 hypothetical protein SERLADRAFT_437421 [Serpula lacrymans var. lacrymans S7.9]